LINQSTIQKIQSQVRSDCAKEQALRGFVSESPTSGKKLIELGCKKERLGSLCRGLARSRNEPERCVENGACKGGRKRTAFGFFVEFQGLFDARFDGALGRVLLCIKRFGTKNWEEFEPPALQKEEQKKRRCLVIWSPAKRLLMPQPAAAAAERPAAVAATVHATADSSNSS
jgi:hypothetical protein